MHRPYVPHVRPFLFVGSLLLFIGSTWGAGWAIASTVGLMLFCGWWVVAALDT
jgi:hypothetical protein